MKDKTDGHIPFFTSDELKHYSKALLQVYGIPEEVKPTGKPGRPRKPRLNPPENLLYAQVVKHRRKGKVVKIETKVVFGTEEKIRDHLSKSPVSNHVNVAFVESNNLTLRERNRRLTRKTRGFSKQKSCYDQQISLYTAYHHFVKTHKGLRLRVEEPNRKWLQRTPAMAAGKTDHIWTLHELLTYKTPKKQSTMETH